MKDIAYLFKKKCVQCSRINEEGVEAYPCNKNPSCPEGKLNIKIGINPEVIRKNIYDLVKSSFNEDSYDLFASLISELNKLETKETKEYGFEGFKNAIGDMFEALGDEKQTDELEEEFLDDDDDEESEVITEGNDNIPEEQAIN